MARRSRLQTLLLEHENNDLHTQLAVENERVKELVNYCKIVENQLEEADNSIKSAQSDLRVKTREVEISKVEHLVALHLWILIVS